MTSKGTSSSAIHNTATKILRSKQRVFDVLGDIGCGTGSLNERVSSICRSYIGVDIAKYEGFPDDREFISVNLDSTQWPIPDNSFDATVAIEVIEHVENPRNFFRELTRITKPGGLIVVTTPNQHSLLNLLCLLVKHQHVHFQDKPGQYPTHLTALLEIDLLRIAKECNLIDISVQYSGRGRIPGTSRCWPSILSSNSRRLSDNIAVQATRRVV